MRRQTRAALFLSGLALVVGLPLLGFWARRDGPPRCAFDGLPIEPVYRVTVHHDFDEPHEFCCVQCAERWLKHRPRALVVVTDEATGQQISAMLAWFVRSSVVTNRVTGNRVHVFQERADAERHAAKFGGDILEGAARPLQ
jgi:hypothetical protein